MSVFVYWGSAQLEVSALRFKIGSRKVLRKIVVSHKRFRALVNHSSE